MAASTTRSRPRNMPDHLASAMGPAADGPAYWPARGGRKTRSGADWLPPDHVHESNHDDCPDQGDDERHDEARRSGSKDQREDKPAYERSNDPEDDIPDDPVAVSTHDLAR